MIDWLGVVIVIALPDPVLIVDQSYPLLIKILDLFITAYHDFGADP